MHVGWASGDADSSQNGRHREAQGRQRCGEAALYRQLALSLLVCLLAQARQPSIASREQISSISEILDALQEGESGDGDNAPGIPCMLYLA